LGDAPLGSKKLPDAISAPEGLDGPISDAHSWTARPTVTTGGVDDRYRRRRAVASRVGSRRHRAGDINARLWI
jgi:hypothetical protein